MYYHFPQGVAVKAGIFRAHGVRRAVRRDGWGGDGGATGGELLRSGCSLVGTAACISYTEVKKGRQYNDYTLSTLFSSLSFNTWTHHSVRSGDSFHIESHLKGSTGGFSVVIKFSHLTGQSEKMSDSTENETVADVVMSCCCWWLLQFWRIFPLFQPLALWYPLLLERR